jgi:amidase
MDESEYLTFDGLGLAELVAEKKVTAAELLAIAQRRADRLNPRINAIVARLDDRAERQLRGELNGPYAGVPFLLKDLGQDLAGTPTSSGCRALLDRPVDQTSTVVQRWLDAGLVIFGKTNTPEFGSKGVTEPLAFGPARNPWNLTRTPGGSSGGSAAAVAAGIVPVAAASDGGGSIRIPAACTGLFGLKAGRGLIPFGPDHSDPLGGLATHGVVSRSVRDAAAMLDVLAGPDAMSGFAPALPQTSYRDDLDRPPAPLRVGFTTYSAIRTSTHPEATRAIETAARLLADLGHEVEEVDPPHNDQQLGRDFLTIWFVQQAIEVDRVKRETGCGDEGFEQDTRLMAALGRRIGGVAVQEAQERRSEHIAGLARLHATHDLLMTPAIGEPPIKVGSLDLPKPLQGLAEGVLRARAVRILELAGIADQVIDRNLGWVPYTQLANVTGRPAMSVPLYWTPDGLPLGVQFVARLGGEQLLLRLARQLEIAAPWADRRAPVD